MALLSGCMPAGGSGGAGDAAPGNTPDMASVDGLDVGPLDGEPADGAAADSTRDAIIDATVADAAPDAEPVEPRGTVGCGRPPMHALGGVQIEERFDPAAGGVRSYFLSLPADYEPTHPYRLIVAYAGTNWSGEMIRPYFGLEADGRGDAIVVYPDLLFRDFDGWGNLGGWLLGPHARPADGMDDIEFTRQLLDRVGERYCVDPERVFATGHSWGGDMAAVVGCFLGDRFTAVAPAAANRPYWFEPVDGPVGCVGQSAVWTFYGQADAHFAASEPYPGAFGDEQDAVWRALHGCADESAPLPYDAPGACVQHTGCATETRYCLYGPATGHQIPPYFTEAVLGWFRGF